MSALGVIAAGAVGYLCGTFPSADIATRLATRGRVDLRDTGSGNPGAHNAMIVLGTKWGAVVLVGDVLKGFAAGMLGHWIGGGAGAYLAATLAIAGHIFPVWSRFRGGKGVATSAGACAAVFPFYFPVDVAVTVAGAVARRRAPVITRVSCVCWIVAALVWWWFDLPNAWGPQPSLGLVAFAVASSALILAKFAASPSRLTGV
jgi:glycerol-3-phosphate acyltransferase PlsY